LQTPPKRDGHSVPCCLARAGRSGVPVACSSAQSGNRADFVHPRGGFSPSRKSRKSSRWFCATMASWKWPLVKVAELGRTCVTIQDNHPHIARPLDAVPKFQHFRCRSHYASRRCRPGSTRATLGMYSTGSQETFSPQKIDPP
jgi:hypothetical protein